MEIKEQNEKEYILNFLRKSPNTRTDEEIKNVSKYLSEHYQYFIKLKSNKDFGYQKIEKITKFLKLETHHKNETIIKFGELGDKFYILLEGSVALYKPIYKETYLTPIEFSELLIKIRDVELDKLKYERLIEKNNHLTFKVREIELMEGIKPNYMFYKVKIFLEELEKIGEFGEGFSFGEMALLKKTTRNATIITTQNCNLLTIEKKDYNNAIKELQEKKLANDIEKFVGSYPIFKPLYKDKIIEILNYLTKKTIYKGEYLYQQKDDSDNIYFLNSGTIKLSFNISFSWLNEYLKYFHNYNGNLLFYLINKKPKKYSDLVDIFEGAKEEMNKIYYLKDENEIKVEDNSEFEKWKKCNEKINEGNLIGIKFEEDKLNNSQNLYSLHLKIVNSYDFVGLEDAIECKKRLFSARCISDRAELNCIKTFDLLKALCNIKDDYLYDFLNYTLKRKDLLKNQVINKIKFLEKDILFSLSNKYDILKGDANNIEKEEDKSRIISVIKMKGFKSRIQDILDKDVILPSASQLSKFEKKIKMKNIYNATEKDLMEKYKKDMILLTKINKLSLSNPHILKLKNKQELTKEAHCYISNSFSKHKNNNYFPNTINKRNKPFIEKNSSFIFNKKNSYQISNNNNNMFDSFMSTPKNNKDNSIKLYSKIIPQFNINKNSLKHKKISLTNRMLSVYTSPLKDVSSTFVDSVDDNRNKPVSLFEIKNQIIYNNGCQLTKIEKKNNNIKILDFSKEKNKENKNQKALDDEKKFYDKLRNKTKEFILGKKFNKKFNHELNKIKPWQYHTFYNK